MPSFAVNGMKVEDCADAFEEAIERAEREMVQLCWKLEPTDTKGILCPILQNTGLKKN